MWNRIRLLLIVGILLSEPCYAAKTLETVFISSTVGFGVTRYFQFSGKGTNRSDEASSQTKIVSYSGIFSQLKHHVGTNSCDGDSTVTLRKNGGNGNSTVTLTASTTGWFEDTTHTDSIAVNDLVNLALVTGGTSGSVGNSITTLTYASDTSTVQIFELAEDSYSATAVTYYAPINGEAGFSNSNATESSVGFTFKTSGTFQKAFIYINENTNTFATTLSLRKNTANGNISISITASTTGIFQDTTHTDSVVSGDIVNWAILGGAEANTITTRITSVEFVTTDGSFQVVGSSGRPLGVAQNAGTNTYTVPGTHPLSASTTADDVNRQSKVGFAFTISNLEVNVVVNGGTTNGIYSLRLNSASSGLSATLTALTTGVFFDNTNTVNIVANDLLAFKFSTGATANSSTGASGFKCSSAATSAIKTINGLAKASVKTRNGLAIASMKTLNGLA